MREADETVILRHRLLAAATALLLTAMCVTKVCLADERDLRDALSAEAARALAEEDFGKLEAMSDAFRRDRARTPAGVWKSDLFYRALIQNSNYAATDERLWDDKERRFKKWLERHPHSPSAQISLGKAYLERAWQLRGRRPASETDGSRWPPFQKQLAVAREHMEKVKTTAGIDPEWHRTMIYVAMGEGWDFRRVQAVIDEAVALEPGYQTFYYAVVEYLTPKWHGSNSMIDQFASWVADRTRKAEGDAMYARIYWYVSDAYYGNARLFKEMKIDWKRMRGGFEDIVARYPEPWNLNKYARFACMAKDYETARTLFARIGQPMSEVWGNGAILNPCLKKVDRLPGGRSPGDPAIKKAQAGVAQA